MKRFITMLFGICITFVIIIISITCAILIIETDEEYRIQIENEIRTRDSINIVKIDSLSNILFALILTNNKYSNQDSWTDEDLEIWDSVFHRKTKIKNELERLKE